MPFHKDRMKEMKRLGTEEIDKKDFLYTTNMYAQIKLLNGNQKIAL